MNRLFTSGLALGALLMFAAAADRPHGGPEARAAAPQAAPIAVASDVRGLNIDDLPHAGECRLWYDALPATHQPAAMDCEHAHWLGARWGGRVIENGAEGARETAAYEGVNDFTGVPVSALPRAGYCRAWLDDIAAADQPAEGDCRSARRTARDQGGRVLFMPV